MFFTCEISFDFYFSLITTGSKLKINLSLLVCIVTLTYLSNLTIIIKYNTSIEKTSNLLNNRIPNS